MARALEDPIREAAGDAGEPIAVYPIMRDGKIIDWYVVKDEPIDESSLPKSVRDALSMFGAWSDLDWDETMEALDRIRHSNSPSPSHDKTETWLTLEAARW
jgi:hypothetical protein